MRAVPRAFVMIALVGLLAAACTSGAPAPSAGASDSPGPQPSATASPASSSAESPVPTAGKPTPAPGGSATIPPVETTTPTQTASPSGTVAPSETVAPVAGEPCGRDGAWVATIGYGLTCVDNDGWQVYTKASGPITSDRVLDVATCPDGQTWIATTAGLTVTDGTNWYDRSDLLSYKSPSHLACDPTGGIWFGYYGGVGHIDAADAVTWYEAANLGTGKYVDQVKGVAVGDDGTLWVATANSVASFNGSRWTVYEQGKGFAKLYYFEGLAVDQDGHPWVGFTDGVFTFNGRTWQSHTDRDLFQAKSFVVDSRNRVWVGTYARGVSVWNGTAWKTYNRASSGLSSDYIHSLATDARDRIWIGTEWGLSVLAGTTWTAYQMHTSALPDNEVGEIAVTGRGPTLPGLLTKHTGTMTGIVVAGATPAKGLKVEVCVEYLGFSYTGQTPCSGQPFVKSGVTGADGRFTIGGLPVGRYSLTVQKPDDSWVRLTDQFKIGDKETLVSEGEVTDLGEVDIAK
jgi:hypothetical protein